MQLADHYKILEVEPSATLDEIRKAYRRLAHRFHPDKTNSDPYALAQFNAIKEAYEVLTNPQRKEKYLQQRWYQKSTGSKKSAEVLTPVSLLKQALELDKYVAGLDVHRMDKAGLLGFINEILSPATSAVLNSFQDLSINNEIVLTILRTARPLNYNQVVLLRENINKVATDEVTREKINHYYRVREKMHKWERIRIWVILAITLLITFAIFLLSK